MLKKTRSFSEFDVEPIPEERARLHGNDPHTLIMVDVVSWVIFGFFSLVSEDTKNELLSGFLYVELTSIQHEEIYIHLLNTNCVTWPIHAIVSHLFLQLGLLVFHLSPAFLSNLLTSSLHVTNYMSVSMI